MTRYAEVIFEPGSHSIVSFESDQELQDFLSEAHRRALDGEPNGPQGGPAERVKRVFLYDEHPADFKAVGNDGNMPVDAKAVSSLVSNMAGKDGTLNMHQLVAALRDEASPVYPQNPGRHESYFKADATDELDLSFLGGDA